MSHTHTHTRTHAHTHTHSHPDHLHRHLDTTIEETCDGHQGLGFRLGFRLPLTIRIAFWIPSVKSRAMDMTSPTERICGPICFCTRENLSRSLTHAPGCQKRPRKRPRKRPTKERTTTDIPARVLDDTVVQRGLERRSRHFGHSVGDLFEFNAERQLSCDGGQRVARCLGSKRRRARETRVHLCK
jgi:hypothetical protein